MNRFIFIGSDLKVFKDIYECLDASRSPQYAGSYLIVDTAVQDDEYYENLFIKPAHFTWVFCSQKEIKAAGICKLIIKSASNSHVFVESYTNRVEPDHVEVSNWPTNWTSEKTNHLITVCSYTEANIATKSLEKIHAITKGTLGKW